MATLCYVHYLIIHHCSAIRGHITFPLKQHKVESRKNCACFGALRKPSIPFSNCH